jgi:hypothetical protein
MGARPGRHPLAGVRAGPAAAADPAPAAGGRRAAAVGRSGSAPDRRARPAAVGRRWPARHGRVQPAGDGRAAVAPGVLGWPAAGHRTHLGAGHRPGFSRRTGGPSYPARHRSRPGRGRGDRRAVRAVAGQRDPGGGRGSARAAGHAGVRRVHGGAATAEREVRPGIRHGRLERGRGHAVPGAGGYHLAAAAVPARLGRDVVPRPRQHGRRDAAVESRDRPRRQHQDQPAALPGAGGQRAGRDGLPRRAGDRGRPGRRGARDRRGARHRGLSYRREA